MTYQTNYPKPEQIIRTGEPDFIPEQLNIFDYWDEGTRYIPQQAGDKIKSDGGPSTYYDFKDDWVTWNDLADYKSANQWGKYSFHLGNIGKALMRWGDKKGTSPNYDARKIVYSGLRVLVMMEGKARVQQYLDNLREDKQFRSD